MVKELPTQCGTSENHILKDLQAFKTVDGSFRALVGTFDDWRSPIDENRYGDTIFIFVETENAGEMMADQKELAACNGYVVQGLYDDDKPNQATMVFSTNGLIDNENGGKRQVPFYSEYSWREYSMIDAFEKAFERSGTTGEILEEIILYENPQYGDKDLLVWVDIKSIPSSYCNSINFHISGYVPVHVTPLGKITSGWLHGPDDMEWGVDFKFYQRPYNPYTEGVGDYPESSKKYLTKEMADIVLSKVGFPDYTVNIKDINQTEFECLSDLVKQKNKIREGHRSPSLLFF